MPLPCQTKFINYINVFGGIALREELPGDHENSPSGVCALNATRSYIKSKNMAALQIAFNGPFNAAKNKLEGCLGHPECLPKSGRTGQDQQQWSFA